jgi:hypothetical protein
MRIELLNIYKYIYKNKNKYIYMTELIIKNYDSMLRTINKFYDIDISVYQNYENKYERCVNFHNMISSNEDNLILFINRKIKLFSSQNEITGFLSVSLFGDNLPIKNLLNNQPVINKLRMWQSMYEIFISVNNYLGENEKLSRKISKCLSQVKEELQDVVKTNIIDVDVNNSTNDMIGDIINSFQNVVDNKQNPFESIMDITTQISEKYYNDINSGEIEIDKLMGSISNNLPGMAKLFTGEEEKKEVEPTVINETFSTADIEVGEEKEEKGGMNFASMMNMASGIPDMGNLMGIVNDLQKAENNDDIEKIKGNMDQYLSKELNIDVNELNSKMSELQSRLGQNDDINNDFADKMEQLKKAQDELTGKNE